MTASTGGSIAANRVMLLLPVNIIRSPGWSKGPLTVKYMQGTPHEITSDGEGRKRYVPGSQIPYILWGDAKNSRRWNIELTQHHQVRTERGHDIAFSVDGLELVRGLNPRTSAGYALIHTRILHDDLTVLRASVELSNIDLTHGRTIRQIFAQHLGGDVIIPSHVRRAKTLAMVCGGADGLPSVAPNLENAWSPREQWLWHLATAHMPGTITVGRESRQTLISQMIHVSDEWKGFVAAEGASYVADNVVTLTSLLAHGVEQRELRVRTMEADALLLAELQDSVAKEISDGLFNLRRTQGEALTTTESVTSYLNSYRMMYWGNSLTERGYSNDLLFRLRETKRMPERLGELRQDIDAAVAEVSEAAESATSSALALLAVVGLPLGTSLSIWSGLDTKHTVRWLLVSLAAAIVFASLLLSLFPGLRRTLSRLSR